MSFDRIAAKPIDARAKLDAYARLYTDVLRNERMCLCGMLAAEYQTLPEPMRVAVLRFFDENEEFAEAPGDDEPPEDEPDDDDPSVYPLW